MSTSREGLRLRHEDAEIVLELCISDSADAARPRLDPAVVYRSIMDSPWIAGRSR